MDELLSLKRDGIESVQGSWFKYGEMMRNLHGSKISMPDTAMFPRVLKALNISPNVRLSVITRLDCQGMNHAIGNLRLVTIELMGAYKEVLGKGENAPGSFVTAETQMADDEQVLMGKVLAVARAKKNGRRPGMETTAVRKAVALSNSPNQTYGVDDADGKGLRCFRCGSPDRMLKSCPNPYTPKVAFAPTTKSSGEEAKPRAVHFSEESPDAEQADQSITTLGEEGGTPETSQIPREQPIETFELEEEQITDEERLQQWAHETIMYSETDLTWYNRGEEISERSVLSDPEHIFVSSMGLVGKESESIALAEKDLGKCVTTLSESTILKCTEQEGRKTNQTL